MKGLIVATQFLTRLPLPRLAVTDAEFAGSMRWFPAVGLIVGAVVAGAAGAGALIDPWLGAVSGLALWVGVTGALHLDGLGDIADATGAAHKDRARMLAALADPHVGSFAVVAIVLQLGAKLVLLHGLVLQQAWLAIVLTGFAARMGPLVWSQWLPDLHDRLGARFRGAIRPIHHACWALALALTAWFSPELIATPLLVLGWGYWLRSRIGGISGDGHGAGIELTETGLLLAAIVVGKLA